MLQSENMARLPEIMNNYCIYLIKKGDFAICKIPFLSNEVIFKMGYINNVNTLYMP